MVNIRPQYLQPAVQVRQSQRKLSMQICMPGCAVAAWGPQSELEPRNGWSRKSNMGSLGKLTSHQHRGSADQEKAVQGGISQLISH